MLCAALTSLLESRQVSSVTSLAARQPVLSLLGCQLSHLTKIGFFFFFFFSSCFQLNNDSDTAARVKRSSSLSDLYSRRSWVSSVKSRSLLGTAITWIQFFKLPDRTRCSYSAVTLLATGLCFSSRLNDSYKFFVFSSLGEKRLGGKE